MFGTFTHNTPSQAQGATSPTQVEGQRAFSESPAFPQIPPNIIKAEEPPLVTVTSDLPEYGGAPSPRNDERHLLSPRAPKSAPRAADSATPGRARLEVVLNASPYKPLPGQALWAETDLDNTDADADDQDELVTTDDLAARKRKAAPPTQAAPSNSHTENLASPTRATGKRPRGRPKGWRPGMPSTKTGLPTASAFRYLDKDGNRIVPPPSAAGAPKTAGPKRRGRPPRAPSPTPREVWERLEPPAYVPFLCEWRGCKAELQNMATLRRHVRKLHGLGGNDGWVCRWGRCGRQEPGHEQMFTRDGFHEHMEDRHLVPFVWYVGDGVRNEKLLFGEQPTKDDEEKIPAYLLGPDGEQITPWVKGQEEEDFFTWRENRNRLKQILLQRDQNAPFEEGDGEEEEVETPAPS